LPWCLALALLVLLGPSCRSPSEAGRGHEPWDGAGNPDGIPGVPPLRRPLWYNFYERGTALAMHGHWALAARDFLTASGQVPGATYGKQVERRRARTYGMHFLEDYFPHREAGVCFFHLGDLERAESELQASLSMLPTSRASVYLNRVRESRLRQSGVRQDAEAIRFAIDGPPDGGYASTSRLALRGTISSPHWIQSVSVNGNRLFIDQAVENYALETVLSLQTGPQTLTLTASDLAGNTRRWERRVTVDLRGPVISMGLVAADGQGLQADILVSDDHELARVLVEGQALAAGQDPRRRTVRVPLAGRSAITVEAEAAAGNRARFQGLPERASQAAGPARPRRPGVVQLAWAGPSGSLPLLAAAAQPPPGAAPADVESPQFTMSPPVAGRTGVTTEEYYLELEVYDRGGIRLAGVRLNDGTEDLYELGNSCHTVQVLTQRLPLRRDPGNAKPTENLLVLRAEDCGGRQQEKRVTIVQRPRYDLDSRLRMQADLLPFAAAAEPALARAAASLHEEIMLALRQPDRQRLGIVRHDPEVLERMKQEIQISHSAMADRVNLTLGKVRVAEWLLRGQASARPGEGNWEVLLEVIDVESTLVVAQVDMHFVGYDETETRYRLAGLVTKLCQILPTASAPVTRVAGRKCLVPLGRQDGVHERMRFVFIPAAAKDDPLLAEPVMAEAAGATGAPEGPGKEEAEPALVEGVVVATADRECTVEIRPTSAAGRIAKDDLAVLR